MQPQTFLGGDQARPLVSNASSAATSVARDAPVCPLSRSLTTASCDGDLVLQQPEMMTVEHGGRSPHGGSCCGLQRDSGMWIRERSG